MTPPRAILLAAGSAQRLRPLTDRLPKCLLEVGGRSIVSRAASLLASHGVTRFTVVDGFEGDRLRTALTSEFPAEWFEFRRNQEYATTNNASSLRLALAGLDEPILLLDADVVFDGAILHLVLNSPRNNVMAVRTRGTLGDEEMKVVCDRNGRILEVGKVLSGPAGGESIGIARFSVSFVRGLVAELERRLIVEGKTEEWYESAFLERIRDGEAIFAADIGDLPAIEIDTPEDLANARRMFPPV